MTEQHMSRIRAKDTTEEGGMMRTAFLNRITTGDARELAQSIPDASIDLIFTDPPYDRASLPLYGWLAEEAARVLRPGGFLLTYVGMLYKQDIMQALARHLTYFCDYVSLEFGHIAMLHVRQLALMHKSILAYAKGEGKPHKYVYSVWKSSIEDKRYHSWGQNISTARYYIGCFSSPGDLVWEPFTGGGTTCYACKQLERDFIGFEIDEATASTAKKRLETVQPLLMPEEPISLDLWEVPA